MFSRRPVRYAEKIERKRKRNTAFFRVGIFIVLCAIIRVFILQTWQVHDDSMQPRLRKSDIVLVVPYMVFGDRTVFGFAGVPQKNAIVLVSDGAETILPSWRKVEDAVLRFITFQRFSPIAREFGPHFNESSIMRIRDIERGREQDRNQTLYQLSTDVPGNIDRIMSEQEVPATRIKGRVVLRIWPLARIGLAQ